MRERLLWDRFLIHWSDSDKVTGNVGAEADLWPEGANANVLRAYSVVPDAVRDWMLVGNAQYLSMSGMQIFAGDTGRSIDRMQIELVAARVSSHNECFY